MAAGSICRSLQVFDLNMWKAWSAVAIAVTSFAVSLYIISVCPAPLLPLAWALSGTAMTGVRCLQPAAHATSALLALSYWDLIGCV